MKTILLLFAVLLWIITLPFKLIDLLVIEAPRELRAKRWRKRAKVGDRGYFINLFGGRTEFTISHIDRRLVTPFRIETKSYASSSSQSTDLQGCYPLKK